MNDEKMKPMSISADLLRVLREKLAAQVDSAAAMVEMDHLVADYLSEDMQSRQHFVSELEKAFKIQLDDQSFESCKTVGELAELVASLKASRKARNSDRGYIIIYRTDQGNVVEEHVRAKGHLEAVEALRAKGLQDVLSVQREEDEDNDGNHRHLVRAFRSCLFPLIFTLLAAIGVGIVFWLYHSS